MSVVIDETHGPQLASWVESANDPGTDFPIQNLPFGRFRTARDADWRIGVAIGDQVLDLEVAGLIDVQDINALMACGPKKRQALRIALSRGLRRGGAERARWVAALRAQSEVEAGLPCAIGAYTDFYAGIHHATTVGKLFRPDNPLLPNYKWVPIGYHGRASSIGASGQRFHRPRAQIKGADAQAPVLAPTARLDYELELGVVIGSGNALGDSVPIEAAETHVFGFVLLNDWSARDVQTWEYQPLGTVAQLIAHHTVNGCNLQPGDLFGTGTISGQAPEQGGSLQELTQDGRRPFQLANGERRTFLEDGDTVILRAHCERAGFRRIGFGECAGTVMPARETR